MSCPYQCSHEVEQMCRVAKGAKHGPAPIPEEGKWVKSKQITDISGLTHGVGWCAPQQGACKLTLNVKDGVIQEALVETLGCSGMTHSAAMAAEILPGKTILEALNSDLVCDAINVAMRSAPALRISARDCVPRSARCSRRWKRVPVTSKWPRAMFSKSASMRTARSSGTSLSTSAR